MEYDNTNSGVLFPAENMKVLRKGPVDIEGNDDYAEPNAGWEGHLRGLGQGGSYIRQ